MKIVPYEIKDSFAVSTFFREIFAEFGWKERASDYMNEPHLLFHLPDNGILLLVKENDKVIGTAGIILLTKTEGLMKRFYVGQSYRGSGIAQQLLKELVKKAKLMGIKKLIFDVSKKNIRAVSFYEKSGFVKTNVTPQEGWPESYLPESHFYFYKMID